MSRVVVSTGLAVALATLVCGCGGGGEDAAGALHSWLDPAEHIVDEGGPVTEIPTPPSRDELEQVSVAGVDAGDTARRSAEELSEAEGTDFEEVQSLYCQLFLTYIEEEPAEELGPWLFGQLEVPQTPPQRAAAAYGLLEVAARKAESPEEEVLFTASATLCSG